MLGWTEARAAVPRRRGGPRCALTHSSRSNPRRKRHQLLRRGGPRGIRPCKPSTRPRSRSRSTRDTGDRASRACTRLTPRGRSRRSSLPRPARIRGWRALHTGSRRHKGRGSSRRFRTACRTKSGCAARPGRQRPAGRRGRLAARQGYTAALDRPQGQRRCWQAGRRLAQVAAGRRPMEGARSGWAHARQRRMVLHRCSSAARQAQRTPRRAPRSGAAARSQTPRTHRMRRRAAARPPLPTAPGANGPDPTTRSRCSFVDPCHRGRPLASAYWAPPTPLDNSSGGRPSSTKGHQKLALSRRAWANESHTSQPPPSARYTSTYARSTSRRVRTCASSASRRRPFASSTSR